MLPVLTAILVPFLASFLAFHCAGPGCACLPVLTCFILIPNLAALAILVAGDRFIRWISLVAASLELGLAFHVLTSFSVAEGGFQFVEKVPWLSNLGINYLLGVDGMSTLMVFLVACVYFAGTLISWNITPAHPRILRPFLPPGGRGGGRLRQPGPFLLSSFSTSSRCFPCTCWWAFGARDARNTRP